MAVLTFLLSAIYVLACLFLIFVVLIQKGEGGGLGGLAGGGAVDVAFGAKADMTWKRATFVAAALFMILSLALGVLGRPPSITRDAMRRMNAPPAPPGPNTGTPAPPGPSSPTPPPTTGTDTPSPPK
ncbi:preprotein translocase subunit SecG [bacterium]|nr:preprotein translocase subunit SecG [bacterium]